MDYGTQAPTEWHTSRSKQVHDDLLRNAGSAISHIHSTINPCFRTGLVPLTHRSMLTVSMPSNGYRKRRGTVYTVACFKGLLCIPPLLLVG